MKRMTKNEKKERIKNYCKELSDVTIASICNNVKVDVPNFSKCKTSVSNMKLVKDAMNKTILEIILKDEMIKDE